MILGFNVCKTTTNTINYHKRKKFGILRISYYLAWIWFTIYLKDFIINSNYTDACFAMNLIRHRNINFQRHQEYIPKCNIMIITYFLPMYNLVTRHKTNYIFPHTVWKWGTFQTLDPPHTVWKWGTFQTLDPPHRWVHYLVDGEVLGRGGDGVLFYQVVHILHHHCLFLQWVNLSTTNERDRNLSSFFLYSTKN